MVDGTTFQPGASGTIDGGATVSVGSDGGSVVIGDGGITTTVYVPGGDPTGSSTPIGSGGSRNKRKHFGTMLFLLTFFLVY